MYLDELFNRALIESGQFLIDDHEIELHVDRFCIIVKSSLATYNRYVPYVKRFNKSLETDRFYTFTESDPVGIPDWISDIVPIRVFGQNPFLFNLIRANASPLLPSPMNEYAECKHSFYHKYQKPTLYVGVSGIYDLEGVYNHKLEEELDENKKKFKVTTITDNDDLFFDLLAARMMKALGRSRRAFTLQDLPIEIDASELVSDGKDLEQETLERLSERDHKFQLAWI